MTSWLLVLIQFLALALIAVTGPLFPDDPLLLAVELAGLALAVWAVFIMGIGNFNIVPDPLPKARLVTRGPYALIRHPMYLALLLATLPLVIASFSWLRLAFWLLLLVDLVAKLTYEEKLLTKQIGGYAEYRRRTKRLIPWVW